jgi:hypothetical protein
VQKNQTIPAIWQFLVALWQKLASWTDETG